MRYFGSWSDPQRTLLRYHTHVDGATPQSTPIKTKNAKPSKPHPDFPLYSHDSGKWAKKVCGKTHYFGTWDDPDGALEQYLEVKDDLLAGRTPSNDEGLTIRELGNRFLSTIEKRALHQNLWVNRERVGDLTLGFLRYRRTRRMEVPSEI